MAREIDSPALPRVFASTGSGGAHLDDTTSGTASLTRTAAVNGALPTAVPPFGGQDAPAVPGRWLERGAISHPAPARPARALPQHEHPALTKRRTIANDRPSVPGLTGR